MVKFSRFLVTIKSIYLIAYLAQNLFTGFVDLLYGTVIKLQINRDKWIKSMCKVSVTISGSLTVYIKQGHILRETKAPKIG